jgi:hypothetical protein
MSNSANKAETLARRAELEYVLLEQWSHSLHSFYEWLCREAMDTFSLYKQEAQELIEIYHNRS